MVRRRARSRGFGPPHSLAEPIVVRPVRRDRADPAVPDHADRDGFVRDQRRLVHSGACEAGESGALSVDEDVGLVRLRHAERPVGELERMLGERLRAHEGTPTRTPRKRAGAAPWETCACCPG